MLLKQERRLLIEESNVEIDPAKVSSGVANENVDLSCIRKYFTDDAWEAVLNTGMSFYTYYCISIFMCILVKMKQEMDIFNCFACEKRDDNWSGSSMMINSDGCLEWFHWYVAIFNPIKVCLLVALSLWVLHWHRRRAH